MRLFIVNPFENVFEQRGIRHLNLADFYSKKKGVEVYYITSDFSHTNKIHFENSVIKSLQKKCIYDVSVCHINGYHENISFSRVLSHWQFSFCAVQEIKKHISDSDVILINSIGPELPFLMRIVGVNPNQIIVDVRDIWPDALNKGSGILKILFKIYCDFLYSFSLKKISRFIIVSTSFAKWVNRYSVVEKKVEYIPLGYDANRWGEPSAFHKSKKIINFVYVGNLNYQFPLEDFILAINDLSSCSFTVIGKGELMGYYKSISGQNVTFKGYLDKGKTSDLIKSADIGILPLDNSAMASTPNKLFDYIGAVCPVLCYSGNDSAALVESLGLGWVVEQDKRKIQEFISQIQYDDLLSKKRNIIINRNRFSVQFLYPRFFDFVDEVAGEQASYKC